ncbi:MAG: KEOPS complex subunit Cgi121 [Candidatus Thermoplasmatota archaeon]|jgi:tRNA threonylcarbamoyladenosine modification (KEOPS) complex Cgi121 subunit
MMDFPAEELALVGLVGPLRLEDVLFQAKKSQRIAPLQVVRADRVVGADHVRQAARCARRAIAEGRSQANSLETEFLRYLAAERQVKSALVKMGLPEVGDSAVAVAFGPKRLDALAHFAEALGCEEDDALAAASLEKLKAFGITDTAMAATTPARRLDLALEAVAAVDLMTR